jgi:hypothetical protein
VSRDPFQIQDQFFDENDLANFRALAKAGPYGNGRVHIGFALDMIFAPGEVLKPYYEGLRDESKGKAKVITSHAKGGPAFGVTVAQTLSSHGLLGPDILLSHSCYPKEDDGKLLTAAGAHTASTPNTELQMGEMPVALRDDHYETGSIGVDCHVWGVTSIPGQMRLLLQAARSERGTKLGAEGLWSRYTGFDAERVFNLATLGGASAAGMQGEIGSLKEGYKADIVVFDTSSPSMYTAALENPLGAIVMHSTPSDVELVIVDGVVRKESGKLVDVVVEAAPSENKSVVAPGTKLAWRDVAAKILESRVALKERFEGLDFKGMEEWYFNQFYLNRDVLIEDQK